MNMRLKPVDVDKIRYFVYENDQDTMKLSEIEASRAHWEEKPCAMSSLDKIQNATRVEPAG
jgi:hypothetical protein